MIIQRLVVLVYVQLDILANFVNSVIQQMDTADQIAMQMNVMVMERHLAIQMGFVHV